MNLERTPGAQRELAAGIDFEALGEMYMAHGTIAREAAYAVDILRPIVTDAVELAEVHNALADVLRRLERIHAVAAAERERWYST